MAKSDDLVKRLRYGIVEHRKRWSGDTHSDIGGSVDYDATTNMMHEAADLIKELEANLAKAAEALDRLESLTSKDAAIVAAALAELKGQGQ